MGKTGQNNSNTEPQQGYDSGQPPYGSGPYYGPNAGGDTQYYDQNVDYSNGPYYGPNPDYSNGQYYGQNPDYGNGQYYGQNPGYGNGQFYDQNAAYNNGQYYGQDPNYGGGPYYGQAPNYNSEPYYGQAPNYNSGPYYGPNPNYNSGPYYGPNPNYGSGPHYGPYYGQPPYPDSAFVKPVREPVSNLFYYILMALTAVSSIVTVSVTISMIRSLGVSLFSGAPADGYATMYSYLLGILTNSRAYSLYSGVNSILGFAILAVSITDIVQVHKKGYPILGMILFTIFCKPGYFLWRAHVVNQKKLAPALFTLFYVLLYAGYFLWCIAFVMSRL